MASSQFAKCEVKGLDSAMYWIKDIHNGMKDLPEVFLKAVTRHVVVRAQANAPLLSSKLLAAIGVLQTVRLSAGVMEATVWSSTIDTKTGFDYAVFQHEFQLPSSEGPSISYGGETYTRSPLGHGPITAARPMTPEGGAGGKYLERVVNFHMNTYRDLLRRMVHRAMTAGDVHQFANYFNS